MKKFVLSGLCCAGLIALLPETGRAHGGQYRGPGDVVPPSPGGGRGSGGPSGPTTGGPAGPGAPAPSGPSTPGSSGPSTGGPSGPSGGGGGTTGGRGGAVGDDLTRWEFWWEFNKDPFIRLRDSIHDGGPQTGSDDFYLGGTRRSESKDTLRPTEEQILGEVLPALKKAIDSTEQRDINSSCMVAMAKIGKDHPDFKLLDVFTPRLRKPDQEVRETAALALGIAATGLEEHVQLLLGLALDKDAGRTASGGRAVDDRTRSFATYGLGLTAYQTSNVELKARVFAACKQLLEDQNIVNRNQKVAAIQAISLLNVGSSTEAEKTLMADALKCLETYWKQSLGVGEQLIQAHVPTSIAKLVRSDAEKSEIYKVMFSAELAGKGPTKRTNDNIAQSCVLALGQLVRPNDEKDEKKNPDAKYCQQLLDTYHDHKDMQTRFFSILALGQIGGEANRATLLKEFDKGTKTQEKPWCALGLGVYSFFKYEAQKKANGGSDPDKMIGDTLFEELKKAKEPGLQSALAIGLGLNQHKEAADTMRSMVLANEAKEELAGYLCIGLALMNDVASKEDIGTVVSRSARRPDLLKQAAVALGKLGDKGVADRLQAMMSEGEPNLAKLSAIASALGFIGDQRTIAPLKKMLFDDKLGDLSRAFAAVALGGVADRELLPWNSKIGENVNYRASVETLTNQSTGILDIL
jgi:HEAT repeat protein